MRACGNARHWRADATWPGLPAERDAAFEPLAEVARAYNLFILTHTSEPIGHLYAGKGDVTPVELQAFLAAFPDLRIVASHWGGGYPFYELMPEVHAAAALLWYDSAASLYLYRPEIFTIVARIAGPEKLLWASDFPLLGQRRMLEYVRASGLSDTDLTLALGGNAAMLLGAALTSSPPKDE